MRLFSVISMIALLSAGRGLNASELRTPPAPFSHAKANAETTPKANAKPYFESQARSFVFGSKTLEFAENGTFKIMSSGKCVGSAYFYISTSFKSNQSNSEIRKIGPSPNGGISVLESSSDPAARSFSVKGRISYNKPGEKPMEGDWSQTATLTQDGKIDFALDFQVPEGQSCNAKGIVFNIPLADGFSYGKEALQLKFQSDETVSKIVNPKILTLHDDPNDSFAILFPEGENMLLYHFPKKNMFNLFPHPVGKTKIRFTIDLMNYQEASPSARVPGGVDFLKTDALEIPSRGKNLLLNPYFAQGAAYLHPVYLYTENLMYYPSRCRVTDETAKFGKYSLKITGAHNMLQVSGIPANPGKYTFSFYAKGKGNLNAMYVKSRWFHHDPRIIARFNIDSPDWKRYEFTYDHNSANSFSIWLDTRGDAKDNLFYIDGMQLEKGTRATEFEAPAVTALFKTDCDRFFPSGKNCMAELVFSTLRPHVNGKVTVEVKNFFDEIVFRKTFDYDVSQGKYPAYPLEMGKLADGIYVASVVYEINGTAQKLKEFFRFSVMPSMSGDYPTKRLFSAHYINGSVNTMTPDLLPGAELFYGRLNEIGIGSIGQGGEFVPKWVEEVQDKNHLLRIGLFAVRTFSGTRMKESFPQLADKIRDDAVYWGIVDTSSGSKRAGILPDARLVGGWTPEFREKFKKAVADRVASDAKYYAYGMGSEWSPELKDLKEYPDVIKAFTEAVKSVHPDAYVFQAGEMNMELVDGIPKVNTFLTRMKKEFPEWKIECVDTHPFTNTIETLYPNFQAFMEMVNRHSKDCGLAFTEGGQFNPYEVEAWNVQLIGWGNRIWAGGTLSYDLGWNEKLSAAYYARFFLVFLTEYGRVWNACSGAINSHNFSLDYELTPRAFQKIPNTLGQLFRAPKKFLGDYSFGVDVKCLVWLDDEGRPLAAVWNEDHAVNRGAALSPYATMNYKNAEYIDLMGVKRTPEIDGRFPVSPFPLFIRGRKGDEKAFVDAISKAHLPASTKLPFRISDRLVSEEALCLTLRNDLYRPVVGTMKVQGRKYQLNIPPHGEHSVEVKLPEKVSADSLREINIPAVFEIDGEKFDYTFRTQAFAAKKFTGDWEKIPAIQMKNRRIYKLKTPEKTLYPGDFEASFQVAWDKENFYLRVSVTDDMLSAGTEQQDRYDYDVCQVYMDTRCSARATGRKLYDDDDYSYSFMPTADGKRCEVWRATSPDIQLTLGTASPRDRVIAKEIPAKLTRTKNGYVYEMTFPADYMKPAILQKGWNLGFAIYVADKDSGPGVKQALSLAMEEGGICWNTPQRWPLLILTD